jgi:hypothetical protein
MFARVTFSNPASPSPPLDEGVVTVERQDDGAMG